MDEGLRVAELNGGGYTFEPISERVIGAAIAVLKKLGPGFREEVYENALIIELTKRGIHFARQVTIPVHYEGQEVGSHTLDLLVDGRLVVELKAVTCLLEVHSAQLMAYLRAADARVGLLLNFGTVPLGIKRLVNRYTG